MEPVFGPDVVTRGPVGSVPGGSGIYVNGVEIQRSNDFEPSAEQMALYAEDLLELYGHADAALPAIDPGELPAASPGLVRELAADCLGSIDERDLVYRIAGWERIAAWAQAMQAAAIDEIARRRTPVSDDPKQDRGAPCESSEYLVHELSALLSCSPSAAYRRLQTAEALRRLPGTREAWRLGVLDLSRVLTIVEETKTLSDEDVRAVEERCLPKAKGRTVGRWRSMLRRQVLAIDASAAAAREQAARQRRQVALYPREDGMASLVATLPAVQARLAYLSVCEHARTAARADDRRTADERCADAVVHLLTCGGAACRCAASTVDGCRQAASAQLLVTVAATTLLGLDEHPAELAGYGPISAATARTLAQDSTWRRLITHPADGTAMALDQTTYRPGKVLGEFVKARDVRCRFPTCGRAASEETIDLDHAVPWPRGATSATNLTAKCRSHHRLKTHGRWRHEQRRDGTVVWMSPTGHEYADPLPPVLEPIRDTPTEPDRRTDDPPF